MILDLRPHKLSYLAQGLGRVLPNGDYIPDPSSWLGDLPCNAVPNGRAVERVFDDGVARLYAFAIYLDANAPTLSLGQRLRLTTASGVLELEVKGFARYQTHCKVWA